jgi:hypothetical protein
MVSIEVSMKCLKIDENPKKLMKAKGDLSG